MKNEFASLACFKGEQYELDFCVDETLSFGEFILIYDSENGFEQDFLPTKDNSFLDYSRRVYWEIDIPIIKRYTEIR